MQNPKFNKYRIYYNFLNSLAKDLNKFYYKKLNKNFKVTNKIRGRGYDPVTTSDKAFEKFIRNKIKKKFFDHQIIGEEYGLKKSKSDNAISLSLLRASNFMRAKEKFGKDAPTRIFECCKITIEDLKPGMSRKLPEYNSTNR